MSWFVRKLYSCLYFFNLQVSVKTTNSTHVLLFILFKSHLTFVSVSLSCKTNTLNSIKYVIFVWHFSDFTQKLLLLHQTKKMDYTNRAKHLKSYVRQWIIDIMYVLMKLDDSLNINRIDLWILIYTFKWMLKFIWRINNY